MNNNNNYQKVAKLSPEQNDIVIDRIINNTSPVLAQPENKPPDKVRERPDPRRSREREER